MISDDHPAEQYRQLMAGLNAAPPAPAPPPPPPPRPRPVVVAPPRPSWWLGFWHQFKPLIVLVAVLLVAVVLYVLTH